ncbi:hypothetical protein KEJ39_05670 [Candidatus Bathyarchaeota archaeon]|nr:hypothetical protein [Candidatus Bathyarchaeota archaeon]
MRGDYLEFAKVALASLILITVFGAALYHTQMRPARIQPDRLVIVIPSQLKSGQEEILKIAAVDSRGEVMASRQDLIAVYVLTQTNASVGIKGESGMFWSKQLQIRLEDGAVEVWIKGGGVETVTILAEQIEGESPLERAVSLLYVGME